MKKSMLIEMLMDFIVLCLMAGSLSASLLMSIYIPVGFIQILLIIFMISITLRLVLLNKWTVMIIIPISIIIPLITILLLQPKQWLASIIFFLSWQINYMSGYAPFEPLFAKPTIWLWTTIICILFYILLIKLRYFIIPFVLGITLLFVLWFLGHEEIVLYIWLFALGCIVTWGGNYHKNLSKQYTMPQFGSWQAYALPLSIVIIITSGLIIPKDTKDMKWPFLIKNVQRIEDNINDKFKYSGPRQPFRLSETGFPSSHDQLGGPVMLNGDLVLEVSSPIPLYLRGSILNEYISTGWQDTIEDMRYRYKDNSWEQIRLATYSFDELIWNQLDADILNEFFPKVEAEITHVDINNTVLFNAQQLENIVISKGAPPPYFNSKGETFTSRNVTPDEPYTLITRIPNLTNQNFRKYLIDMTPTIDWRQPLPEVLWKDDVYHQKVLSIQENYMNIPDTVPQRVFDLVDDLTADKTSSLEKMLTIQDYLQNNFTYTLVPPFTPSDQDFVDYFLFELKEGYCTYFATAMAVMGRIAGIPTRYVEGFLMPSNANKDNIYEVKKLNGHAWVEIYFPKIGWITFDATPPGEVNDSGGAGTYSGQDLYWENYLQRMQEQQEQQAYQPQLPDTADGKPQHNTSDILINIGVITLIVLSSLLSLLSLGLLLCYIRYWRRVGKQTFHNQLHTYYKEILWLLKLFGSPIEQGETPYAYAAKVDKWLVNPEGSMTDISNILVSSEFGHYQLNETDIVHVKTFYQYLKSNIREVIGYPRFILHTMRRLLTQL